MQNNKKYHAFISYCHMDKSYATAVQKSIETLGLPFLKRWSPNVNIFRDERKIPLSGSLTEEIITGLKESEHLIVIASKNSANSNWVKDEIINWHKLNKDEKGYITNFNFILVDDIIEWDYLNHDFDKLRTNALPSFENKIFKELPLWANLQSYCNEGKVKSRNSNYEWEIAKIKGLLLDKKPDEIIDDVSKQKRIFFIIISIVISTFILISLYTIKEVKQKKQINASREYLRDYLPVYKEFKKNQLDYAARRIYGDTLYFDFDKSNLGPDSAFKLDKLIQVLNEYPESFIFIECFQQDDESKNEEGEYVYDFALKTSIRRSKSINTYIISKGINPKRIESIGVTEYIKTENFKKLNENEKQQMRKAEITICNN